MVPSLGDWIARQCDLSLADGPSESADLESSSRSGAIAAFIAQRPCAARAAPAAGPARTHHRVRVGLAAGMALAGALIGWQGREAWGALQSEYTRLAALQSRAESDRQTALVRSATFSARLALAETEARAARTAGEAADAAATLAAIAAAAQSVRISSIHIAHEADACVARISGFVRLSESEDPATDIRAFVEALSASPIAGTTRLSATQRVQIDGAQSQAFDIALHLVRVPVLRGWPRPESGHEQERSSRHRGGSHRRHGVQLAWYFGVRPMGGSTRGRRPKRLVARSASMSPMGIGGGLTAGRRASPTRPGR